MAVSFDFLDTKTKYKDDPCFVHLNETIKVLTKVATQHFTKFIRLSKTLKPIVAFFSIPDAGDVFNKVISMIPYASISNSEYDLTQEEFVDVLNTFCSVIMENSQISHYAKSFPNPEDCVFEFCHSLFIPVRADHVSIPKSEKMNFLKKWFTIVFSLPFIKIYTDKFNESINRVQFIQTVYIKLLEDPNKVDKFKQIDYKFIHQTVGRAYNEENPTQIFIRIYMNVALVASMEILQKWCPNIKECLAINPNFDGRWINPFDQTFNDQIAHIKKITGENLITHIKD
jgi:hypothetical protein